MTGVLALAVLCGLGVRPDLLDRLAGADAAPASDSYAWNVDTAAERVRQDQCLVGDVLRLGGPSMARAAQDGLNQTPDKLSGNWSGCAWASLDVASLFAGKILRPIADAVRAADAAARTGVGFADAWKGLRSLGLTDEAIAGIGAKAVKELSKTCGKGVARKASVSASATIGCWLGSLNGPGQWSAENEGMDAAAAAYQQRVTGGVPAGFAYRVKMKYPVPGRTGEWVKFDGFQDGKLLDAKYWESDEIIDAATGKFKPFITAR